jgi:hypothetical protein
VLSGSGFLCCQPSDSAVGVGCGVTDGSGWRVGLGVFVGWTIVGDGTGVSLGAGIGVSLGAGIGVSLGVGSGVAVTVGVAGTVSVTEGVAVGVVVSVLSGVFVTVAVVVCVAVGEAVGVIVGVLVTVGVDVDVGVGFTTLTRTAGEDALLPRRSNTTMRKEYRPFLSGRVSHAARTPSSSAKSCRATCSHPIGLSPMPY